MPRRPPSIGLGSPSGHRRAKPATLAIMQTIELDALRQTVTTEGWSELAYPVDAPLEDLARGLGDAVPSRRGGPAVEVVVSVRAEAAHPASLSRRHGTASFPLHNDGAHHVDPPSWVLLRQIRGSAPLAETVLASTRWLPESLRSRLRRATCIVRDGRRAFAAVVASPSESHGGVNVRWDPGCMSPTDERSAAAVTDMLDVLGRNSAMHEWKENSVLLIRNRSVLHGRTALRVTTGRIRALERALILDSAGS